VHDSTSFQVYNASAGSGKTFTLVKEYLKILLTSENASKFQQILAVTFTNKAAGEMKERVIENLHKFSKKKTNEMLPIICKETNLSEAIIFGRAKNILNALFHNYSAFSITTIDSFTHKLIRTFAHDLGLPLSFEVEMDAERLLNEAVDVVISKIGDNERLTKLLVNYSIQKLEDDKAWDISKELKSFAKIILNENHSKHLKLLHETSTNDFKYLKEKLQKENKSIEEEFRRIGTGAINIIEKHDIEISDFAYAGELPKHFIKLRNIKRLKPGDLKFEGRLNKTFEENKNVFSGKCSTASKEIIENITDDLKKLYADSKKLYNEVYGQYILSNLIIESLVPLAVLNHTHKALQELKTENNILLNAEFNQLISDTIKDEPAPFIYERLGDKFRYYFIDEMQDTSELQWKNLIPLIDHAISSENELGERGKLMLVGDAKQSIYRWRGGKAAQFIDLSAKDKSKNPFYIDRKIEKLETNFRSYSEIIDFNNRFFRHISKFLTNNSYRELYHQGNEQEFNKNEGGYVQLSFVEKQKEDEEKELVYPKKVAAIIDNLDSSFQKNEVCVLVRTRKQGIAVADYLSENGIEIISSETLLLKNSEKVKFIIDLLNTLQNPLNKEYKIKLLYFLHDHLKLSESKHHFISKFIDLALLPFFEELRTYGIYFNYNEFIQYPFYESFEHIVRSFNLSQQSDSNIQFFLEVVFEFQQKTQGSIGEFLEFWELKQDSLSIVTPEAKNAVRIMTIHKAKGLEFPVVIFPFDIDIYRQINPKVWYLLESSNSIKSVLLNYSDKLNFVGEQGKKLFDQRREELELDNFNILYVALTRAIEQLYIITEKNTTSNTEGNIRHTSGLFINYLQEIEEWNSEKNDFNFGNANRVHIPLKKESIAITQSNFISYSWKNHNISIVENSSLLWDTDQGIAIVYGNLIHEILSKIKTKNDIFEVLNQYVFKGIITSKQHKEILKILNQLIHHKKLSKYFEQNNLVYNEREIMTIDKKIVIPDRLIFRNDEVTILDYKTGKPKKEHRQQILKYAEALKNLNYSIDKKILVYINEDILVEEV
jgi:ATP-dependent exoDNAse (exonuclease V) beta subunit